jgi:hypothetical protein
MAWRTIRRADDFARFLAVDPAILRSARRERGYVYIELDCVIKNKLRHLCYPRPECHLYRVQAAIKEKCLEALHLSDAIRGYRKGQHHINCANVIAGQPYVATLDIKDFHPSITPNLVTRALRRFNVSHPVCRIITQLVTYNEQVPQGAPTSNHIANLVIDMVLTEGVLEFCGKRGVIVVNFGDDTAFGGEDRVAVDECVEFAKRAFARYGLTTNSKSCCAEHIGATRKFVGTSTARQTPDITRKKYRVYRADIRAALKTECDTPQTIQVDETAMRSFHSKIAYVKRMNKRKARCLSYVFFRLAGTRMRKRRLRPRSASESDCGTNRAESTRI